MLKRLPCRGALLPTCFYANSTKGHGFENKKQDSGKRAKLRRAAPRDEHSIGQVSGDMKDLSSQEGEHERASQLQKVVHTDPLALANSSDPCAVRRFFFLTNVTFCKSMIYILVCVLQSLKKSKTHKMEKSNT